MYEYFSNFHKQPLGNGLFNQANQTGNFSPSMLPTLLLWLDGSDPSNTGVAPPDGSPVSSWIDKSPNGYNFFQSTPSNQPVNANNLQNGLNAVHFGTSGLTRVDSTASINLTSSFSLCMAIKPISMTRGYINELVNSALTPDVFMLTQSNQIEIGNFNGVAGRGDIVAILNINNFVIVTYVYDVTGFAQMWINGVSAGIASTTAYSAALSTPRRIGSQGGSGTAYWQGYLGDFIWATGVWSGNIRRKMELWAGKKWGVPV